MPWIDWVREEDASGEVAAVYEAYLRRRPDRSTVADIIKCFSHRPDFMRQVMDFSWSLHFSDGHLTERIKEMIATAVSARNRCPYCTNSHAYMLRGHGADDQMIRALGQGDVEAADVSEAERALLRFAVLLNDSSHRNSPQAVQKLREAGWSDPQIAEAVYIVAIFAFFNRVANAFGLVDPKYFEAMGLANPLADHSHPASPSGPQGPQ